MHTVHTVHALLSYEDFHGDSLSLPILMVIFQVFIEGNDDGSGGNNWSYKSFKAPVKSSPPTNQHPVFLQAECPSCRPTNSVKALTHSMVLLTPSSPGVFQLCL